MGPPPLRNVSGGIMRLVAYRRLTALRQSPTYTSKQPKNSGHPTITPQPPNGSCPDLFCNYRPISSGAEDRGNAGLRAAPYDSAVRAPGIPACAYPLTRTVITNNVSQTYPNSPNNASKTLESKETNGELRHSDRLGWAVVRHHALSRRRRSTPTLTLNMGGIRGLVAPLPFPSKSIYV